MGVNEKYNLLSFSLCDFSNFPLLSLRHFSTISTIAPNPFSYLKATYQNSDPYQIKYSYVFFHNTLVKLSKNCSSSEWLCASIPERETDTPVMFSNVKARLLLLSPEGWRTSIFLELE
jgi:hypothetical protein